MDLNEPRLLTWDELRILESISHDETKSADERAEAKQRLSAGLEMRLGMADAAHAAALTRVADAFRQAADAFIAMGKALDALIEEEWAALSREERGQVVHLVEHEDECILDAICKVKGEHDESGEES